MKVKAIKCPTYGDVIYSRARHDMHSCTCGDISIDGGFDYVAISYTPDISTLPPTFDLEVDVDRTELWNDWNRRKNKFGLIKKEKNGNETH